MALNRKNKCEAASIRALLKALHKSLYRVMTESEDHKLIKANEHLEHCIAEIDDACLDKSKSKVKEKKEYYKHSEFIVANEAFLNPEKLEILCRLIIDRETGKWIVTKDQKLLNAEKYEAMIVAYSLNQEWKISFREKI